MDRRDFLKKGGVLAGGAALGGLLWPRRTLGREKRRPDVLFIAIEDIATYQGCYGHPMVKTPNIDALARRGVLFTNAHCQVPVCNPSRASIATGLRPATTGVYGNSRDWRRAIPEGMLAMPEFFRDHGYETVRCGKIHHHERYFKDSTKEAQERERRFWHRVLRPRGGKRATKKPIAPRAPRPEFLKENDYIARSLRWGPTGLTDAESRDGAIARTVGKELTARRARPLFMAVGFHAPHYKLLAPDRYFDMYPADRITLPENPENDLDDVPIKYPRFNTTDEIWLDEDEKRQVTAAYYACISHIDTCVGMLMDALEKSGREDNTIICLWGDHGMHFGEHFLWRKHTLFENATRVPFVMAAPGVTRARSGRRRRPDDAAASVCSRPVELIDMYPTLVDLCGFDVPEGMEAISMRPLLQNPQRRWKRAAFSYRGKNGTSIRTERWRYTEWGPGTQSGTGGAGRKLPGKAELYDHESDPGEFSNLAKDPEHARTVAELSRLLKGGWKAALPG